VLRKAAVAAVESALVNGCVSHEIALEALLQHLPTWITVMDDDEPEARFTAFKACTAWCTSFLPILNQFLFLTTSKSSQ
jgi:hypothetical protein